MRILHTTTVFLALALIASAACAAPPLDPTGQPPDFQDPSGSISSSGVTGLKVSPMHLEIQKAVEKAQATEQRLLKELAAATEDEEAERLVHRIERLETELKLAVLKIQVHYAHAQGHWDLEYRLRARIMKLLEGEAYAVK